MFCGECGVENPETNVFCKNCGKPLKKSTLQATPQSFAASAPGTPSVPMSPGTVTAQGQTGSSSPSGIMGTIRSRKSLVASVIFGVASALILPYVFGALAIILGTWVVYKKDKWGFIGIFFGLLVILIDYFYIVIFP